MIYIINMNGVAGIIFSNLHDRSVPELTAKRTMGAIPFGGGYRMVDFPLSAMANAGIKNVSVIAHHNYESLVEHIGNGADWGIPTDRGGVKIVSPYMTSYAKCGEEEYTSRLDTLKSICDNVERMKEKYVVMCDCDCVFNFDVTKLLEFHVKMNADLTVCTDQELCSDGEGRILEIDRSPANAFDLNVNMWVVNRDFLVGAIKNAVARRYSDLTSDLLCRNAKTKRFFTYGGDGEFLRIKSLSDYYRISMRVLNDEFRKKLFDGVRSRKTGGGLTKIGTDASVAGSLIFRGCSIDGRIENCIVFGGVCVEKGALVRNSILLPGVKISENARLDFVVADRNTNIRQGNVLAGCQVLPFFIDSDKIV